MITAGGCTLPTLLPTSLPSPRPSPRPSTADTVSVAASLTMEGLEASTVTAEDMTLIEKAIAAIINGVEEEHITSVSVTDSSSRRRLEATSSRALLATAAATVAFTVSVPLTGSSFTSADDLQGEVSTTLISVESDSSTLVNEIKAAAATMDAMGNEKCTLMLADSHTLKALPAGLEKPPEGMERFRGGLTKIGSGDAIGLGEPRTWAGVGFKTVGKPPE